MAIATTLFGLLAEIRRLAAPFVLLAGALFAQPIVAQPAPDRVNSLPKHVVGSPGTELEFAL